MTRAIMILARDGNLLIGNAYVPNYHTVTWSTYEDDEHLNRRALEANMRNIQYGPMSGHGKIVFAVWTAPMDETRFALPMWVQEKVAAAGVHVRC